MNNDINLELIVESNFTLIYTDDELEQIIAEWNNVVSNVFLASLNINTFTGYFSNHTLLETMLLFLIHRDRNMHTHTHTQNAKKNANSLAAARRSRAPGRARMPVH